MSKSKPLGDRLRDAVLEYAAMGFKVFPLKAQDKRPLSGSHGIDDATDDCETILQWWEDHPQANIGINCGASGLVVLDVDVKDGKDARPAVRGKDLSGALVVRTPSGGYHYYWKSSGHKFQSGSNLYGVKGLDVRADGGYAVAPPSVYIKEMGEKAKPYRIESGSFDRIGPVPAWLVELEEQRQSKKRCCSPVAQPPGGVTPAAYGSDVLDRARAYIGRMPEAVSGRNGHTATLKAATALVVGFRLAEAAALDILRRDYNPRCNPPWSERELLHKVREAAKNGRGLEPGYLLSHGQPLRNYTLVKVVSGNGEDKEVPRPVGVEDICGEICRRFENFPKKIGERLFDFDDVRREVVEIGNVDALSAWIQRRGACQVDFIARKGFTSFKVVYENLLQTAESFDAVALAPFYPPRSRVFNLFGELPEPSDDHKAFWGILDYMSPATEEDKLLMAAFFCAPMYFSEGGDIDRPGWAVDTVDAQGSGKTSVVETCAKIYGCTPIALDFSTLDTRAAEVKKRIISTEGRATRLALFDNVTAKKLQSATLSDLITAKHITERAAYGRNEERRPNDLTFAVTFNGGRFDTDTASRFYLLKVKEPEVRMAFWKSRLFKYIEANRLRIFADIIDMISQCVKWYEGGEMWQRKRSRFPEFDGLVLAAVCRDRKQFEAVDAYLSGAMAEANDDREKAERFENALTSALNACGDIRRGLPVVVYASDVDKFISASPDLNRLDFTSKDVRTWVRGELLPRFDKKFRSITTNNDEVDGWRNAAFLIGVDLFKENDLTEVQVFKGDWGSGKGTPTYGRVVGTVKMRRRDGL